MMWMPLRSVRMKRLTFGFHRRVWCPKWTPLSSSWRMVTTAMAVLLFSTLGSAACGCVFRRTDGPASLVPGTLPLPGRDRPSRPVGVHAARSEPEVLLALWARVFTPRVGASSQCTSRHSSPAFAGDLPSPSPSSAPVGANGASEGCTMTSRSGRSAVPRRADVRWALAVAMSLALASGSAATAGAFAANGPPVAEEAAVDLGAEGWVWPVAPFRLARPFVAPPHEYGPGHRGIDLDLLGGTAVRAPADGVVAFSGGVAGRGILTIDH